MINIKFLCSGQQFVNQKQTRNHSNISNISAPKRKIKYLCLSSGFKETYDLALNLGDILN